MSTNIMVKVCDTYDEAAKSVNDLIANGVLKKYISVLAKGEQEKFEGFKEKKEASNIIFWGEQGAFWGSLWGLLAGGVFLWVPGFGPLVATGQIISAIVGMIGGAAVFGTAGAMTAWFIDMGIEKSLAHKYGDLLKDKKILVIVHGDADAVKMANDILKSKVSI